MRVENRVLYLKGERKFETDSSAKPGRGALSVALCCSAFPQIEPEK
jgi:hypothetical protein